MARPKKPWSKVVEEVGVAVRLYERAPGSPIYREVRAGEGAKDRKSLGHADRQLAEQQARALARLLGELRLAGQGGLLTFGRLAALYERDAVPNLSSTRQRAVRGMLQLLERQFGRGFDLNDLSQHTVDGYVRARSSGRVKARHRTPRAGVLAGTIRNELHLVGAMITWGQSVKVGGRRLISGDLMAGIAMPSEKNAKRPIATEARYRALLAVADTVEPSGRFRCVLTLARMTGSRIAAICALRRSDVLLSVTETRRALAAAGMDLAHADHWPSGAIFWPSSSDKLGFEAITPISAEARAALDAYLRSRPSLGDAPLLPGLVDVTRSIGKEIAGYRLQKAETAAELVHMERGGYHQFRRLWASERRHLPAQDVAAAGGWRSLQVMRGAYQQADAATVHSVVESRPGGLTPDTPSPDVKQAQ